MPKSRHFGAGSDTMQQVHGADVKSNKKSFLPDCKEMHNDTEEKRRIYYGDAGKRLGAGSGQ